MLEFLVFFVHRHFEFRYPELEALLAMQGLPLDAAMAEAMAAADPSRSPLLRLSLPTVEHAKFLSERGILVKGVYEVWGHAASTSDYARLVASVAACAAPDKQRVVQDAACSWRISVDAFGKKLSMDEQRARRDRFREVLPFAGPVQMREPDETFLVLEEFAVDEGDLPPDAVPKQLLFLREVAGSEKNRGRGGARDLVDQQTLKRRAYIGPTSMESEMALLMSNMALVRRHDLVVDPFVGTGSVLIPCATHGAVCYGTDIDIRVLLGTGVGVSGAGAGVSDAADDATSRVNVLSNFKQYGLPLPELIRADNSRSPLVERCRDLFDAVVCDPPYGIRAGARKSGRKRSKKGDEAAAAVDKTKLPNYIPPTQPYAAEDVMSDLLEFSARTLRVGGRLVYLLPTTYEYTDADLPRHPRLRVIANSEQKLTTKYARRLITMVKLAADGSDAGPPVTAAAVVADGSASFANLREKIRKRKSPDAAQEEQDS